MNHFTHMTHVAQKALGILLLASAVLGTLYVGEALSPGASVHRAGAWDCTYIGIDADLVKSGDTTTLHWKTYSDVEYVTISGFGDQQFPRNGSVDVTPAGDPGDTVTYTVYTHVDWTDDTLQCSVDVEIDYPDCECALTASQTNLKVGETTTISWDSVAASDFTITRNGEVVDTTGQDSDSGSFDFTPTAPGTYTFVGTFTSQSGDDITCEITVVVEEEQKPFCEFLNGSPAVITSAGQAVELSWKAINVTSGTLSGVGAIDAEGSTTVNPSQTTTYTAVFEDAQGNSDQCEFTVTLEPGNGSSSGGSSSGSSSGGSSSGGSSSGGGSCINCNGSSSGGSSSGGSSSSGGITVKPEVELVQEMTPAVPGTFIYLDQVPYTGFEATPLMTAVFWLGLLAISALMSYLIVVKRVFHRLASGFTSEAHGPVSADAHAVRNAWNEYQGYPQEYHSQPVMQATIAAPAPFTPTYQLQSVDEDSAEGASLSEVEEHAQNEGILFSPEALHMIEDRVATQGMDALTSLIEDAKAEFPREDGWILLSKERVQNLIADNEMPAVEEAPVQESVSSLASVLSGMRKKTEEETTTTIKEKVTSTMPDVKPTNGATFPISSVVTFTEWLVDGEQQKAFEFIRKLSSQSYSVENFFTQIVRELDEVYKNRIEGDRRPNAQLVQKTAAWTNGEFERVLGILVESVDYSYHSSRIGTKVALTKIFEFFASKKQNG